MKYEKNIIKAAPTINTIGLIFFLFFLISKAYHKNSGRSMVVIKLKLLRFQFKLFANNATKFGAPGNRTPLSQFFKLDISYQINLKMHSC